MSRAVAPAPSAWRRIILLGEMLLEVESLATQCEIIIQTTSSLLDAQAYIWLDGNLFRLPGLTHAPLFPSSPPTEVMRQALTTGAMYPSDTVLTLMAVPLRAHQITLGVIQVERLTGVLFRKAERELLDGLAGHVALALTTSRRMAVEQLRLEQLTLVRKVNIQIANVLNLDELTRRVTDLILKTFHYYYVAIFTLDPGQSVLHFQSSAGPARHRRKRRISPALRINLGEGLIGGVAQSGEEIVANDVQVEPRFRFIDSLPETQSEVVLPLKIEDRILGVLDVQSDQRNAFHPNDLLVLRSLADTIAIAINGVRLYGDLQKRAEQLALVAEVVEDITSSLDPDELLGKVASLIQERLGLPHVHLFTVHLNRRKIIYEAGSGVRNDALKGFMLNLDTAEGIIPWVARSGETLLANDVSQEPRYRPSPFPPEDTLAELAIPLIYGEEVVGVLDLQSDQPNAFSEDVRFLCEALADNIAAAIHNADLYRSERWRRQVAEGLREVAGLLSADVSLDNVLDAILRELERNLPCDVSAIWLMEGDELYLAHIHGAEAVEVEAAMQQWPETVRFLTATLDAVEPVVRKPTDPLGPTGAARGFAADYSSIAAALRIGDQPLGVLTLSHHTPGRYGHEAQDMTATFANYAAVAIQNARLYDSAQEQAYASAALLQVAQTVANSDSLEEIIGSIVRIAPILVGVEACGIYLLESDVLRPSKSYGFPESVQPILWGSDFVADQFPLLSVVSKLGQMVIGTMAPSVPEDWLKPDLALTEEDTFYALETGRQLLIGIPLMIKNVLFGVMLILETDKARRFRRKRIEIVNSVAQQVALAIQDEHFQREMVVRERLEQEVQLARQIQKTFLPERLPKFPDWELAATWRTARQVGGDFYDVIELPNERLGLLIADVSDKGIPAALFMALTRTLVRAAVYDTPSPAEVLRRVNALIIPDNRQGMFVTAVYGVLSLESGEFTYANAGHNPPIFSCRKGQAIEFLPRTGAALGVIEELAMKECTIRFDPGDCLLLYTDGLTEAFSPAGEIYGEERMCQVFRANVSVAVRDLLDAMEASVDAFMGPLPASDDMTMLSLRKIPK